MTRKEAITAGEITYIGRPCRHHGPGIPRYVVSTTCVRCKAEMAVRWRANHLELSKSICRRSANAWRLRNPEKHLNKSKARYYDDPLKIIAYVNAWRDKNPERHRLISKAAQARRRARKTAAGGSFKPSDVEDIMRLQKHKCALCRKSIKKLYDVDHILPLVLGGCSNRKNIQLLCPSCNRSKAGRHPIDFARKLGRLL